MADRPNAQVIVCKCGKTKKMYGMRAEETARNVWHINWAFPVSEARASAEKYETTQISGDINMTDEFPGCPHCGNTGFFSCGACHKLTCYDGQTDTVTCAHCGRTSRITGTISKLDVGGDI